VSSAPGRSRIIVSGKNSNESKKWQRERQEAAILLSNAARQRPTELSERCAEVFTGSILVLNQRFCFPFEGSRNPSSKVLQRTHRLDILK
jgi:hypothetical protein